MSAHAIPMDTGDAGTGTGDGAAGGASGAVLAAFASAADAGQHVPTARTGSTTAARTLAAWLPTDIAPVAIWTALEALEADGLVKRASYITACRHVRQCFVLATAADARTAADAADAADGIAAEDADEPASLATLEAFAAEHSIDFAAARTQLIPLDAEFACRQLAADVGDGAEVRCVALWLRLLAARA